MTAAKTVTAIEIQKGRKNRVSVFLDHLFAFGIDQDVLVKAGIATGDQLSEERIAAILEMEERHTAKQKALRWLAVRDRSRKELETKLRMAKFAPATITWTLQELERLQLTNDTAFARSFSQNRMVTRPVGKRLLARELQQKGLSETAIEQGLEKAYENLTEEEVAKDLAQKRKKSCLHLPEEKAKKRVADFLLRRGFSWSIVEEILDNWNQY